MSVRHDLLFIDRVSRAGGESHAFTWLCGGLASKQHGGRCDVILYYRCPLKISECESVLCYIFFSTQTLFFCIISYEANCKVSKHSKKKEKLYLFQLKNHDLSFSCFFSSRINSPSQRQNNRCDGSFWKSVKLGLSRDTFTSNRHEVSLNFKVGFLQNVTETAVSETFACRATEQMRAEANRFTWASGDYFHDLARLFDKRLRDGGLKAIIRAGITASQLYASAHRLSSSFHSFLSSLIIAMARRGQRAAAQMSTGNWMFQGDTKKAMSVRPFFFVTAREPQSHQILRCHANQPQPECDFKCTLRPAFRPRQVNEQSDAPDEFTPPSCLPEVRPVTFCDTL